MAQKGISRILTEVSLPHSTEKLRRKTLLFCNKILVSKIFMEKGGREYQGFPSQVLCLTGPKKFVVEPFSVSLLSGS